MTVYGYVRKNFPFKLKTQLEMLRPYSCDDIFIESESLIRDEELFKLLALSTSKDTLVAASIATFGKHLWQNKGTELMIAMQSKEIRLISIDDEIDTRISPEFYDYFTLFAENNRLIRSGISQQSILKRKEAGQVIGRPSLCDEVIEKVEQLYHEKRSLREIAEICGISLGSAHKYVTVLKQ